MRSYAEGCPAAHALDVVGERWGLLIVRELLFSPKRFTDLDTRLAGASASVLTQRLRDLVDGGVVARRKLPPPASSWVYELTDWGRELEPIVVALGRWGCRSPQFDNTLPVTPAAIALGIKTFADPARVAQLPGPIELQLDDEVFTVTPDGERLAVAGTSGPAPVARIIAQPGGISPFLQGRRTTRASLRAHGIRTEGDAAVATALLDALHL
ncbi:MAG TPA: helix-turn-helix domain-containing protein [Jatrophihabitantaceae bacterium]|jgi:DNA-binding HxlR family transcriptional regulator